MQNPVVEAQVGRLVEENEQLQQRIAELEKKINKKENAYDLDLSNIFERMKSMNLILEWYIQRKSSIDALMEKIKKFLPIGL